jgi:2-dehydro-3-deoxyphosphogluconate aldolase/(4S)-4-hydroxy-2-oxoglutarate aldolase
MEREQQIKQQVKQQGILPLFYHNDSQVCMAVTRSLYDAGIRIIEFTNRGEKALANFKELVLQRDKDMKDLLLAVGTIKTTEHAKQFIDAGADFLISPVFDNAVCDEAYLQKIFWIPGCMTPTEIHMAEQAGCTLIKLFPGNVLGPSFVEAIKPLFSQLDFVVTGGVDTTEENIKSWFKSGVCAVGMGSKLISKKLMEQKDYSTIEKDTKTVLALLQSIKK